MTDSLDSSMNLPLARSAVDRDYLSRSRPELFDELWANPSTRVLAMFDGAVLLHETDGSVVPNLKLLTVEEVPSAKLRVFLGVSTADSPHEPAGTPIVLAVLTKNAADLIEADSSAWHQLRKTGAGLSDRDAGLFTQALALSNWHSNHEYCSRCGTPTVIEQGGWVRRCFKDDSESYPRTDPAVIVALIDDQDRILLGSQGIWEENRWSILAGFVEPGESLDAAVLREMFEEAGVRVSQLEYLASQAWPFPYSLMLGFSARVEGQQGLKADGVEIEKLRWFSRAELADEAGQLLLPNRISIARAIIERWYGGPILSKTELQ